MSNRNQDFCGFIRGGLFFVFCDSNFEGERSFHANPCLY